MAYSSDGVTEPENEFGEFGEERLIELVKTSQRPLPRITEIVAGAVTNSIGGAAAGRRDHRSRPLYRPFCIKGLYGLL